MIRRPITSVLLLEAAGFFVVIMAVWFNEYFDLPHYLFGMPLGRFNYHEAFFESLFILTLAVLVMTITWRLTKRVSQLESLLPICAWCKKIREPNADADKHDSWKPMEVYIREHTGSEFTHGLCPDCLQKNFGKYLK